MITSKAQIVATIGPASKTKEIIKGMVEHQMDVARLNFSWGTYEEHANYIKNIRESAEELGKKVPIIQDLSGPREQDENGHKFGGEGDPNEQITTLKDIKDLEFGISQNLEYVAQSFVGTAEDVAFLKKTIKEKGGNQKVIAKIERRVAFENLTTIIKEADAIMIARGDLGNEFPLEQIPFIEKEIIEKCKKYKKPVIVATQMMLSMTENPIPTRAEVTDVAFAIINGADAVMLSEESASGKYPLEAVKMMEKIILESERYLMKKNQKNSL
jgi:pyruvate kinase